MFDLTTRKCFITWSMVLTRRRHGIVTHTATIKHAYNEDKCTLYIHKINFLRPNIIKFKDLFSSNNVSLLCKLRKFLLVLLTRRPILLVKLLIHIPVYIYIEIFIISYYITMYTGYDFECLLLPLLTHTV